MVSWRNNTALGHTANCNTASRRRNQQQPSYAL
jgi:hypothetical protein